MLSPATLRYKPNHVKTPKGTPICDMTFIRLRGKDAQAFAQSQFMNDVALLAPGQWHWNGWLNAKGRVQALFALACLAADDLLLVMLDAEPQPFADSLKRFVFRSKVEISVDVDLEALADFAPEPRTGPVDCLLVSEDGGLGFDFSGSGDDRVLWVVGASASSQPADAAATARWRRADLAHGLPRWAADREHGWTPHMLSLDRLGAFSVRKGCYPGQEIVARTHFLGQTKRQAWWLDGEGLASGQAPTDADGRAIGEIIEADAAGRGALAVLSLPAEGPVLVEGRPATARRPQIGLARPIRGKALD